MYVAGCARRECAGLDATAQRSREQGRNKRMTDNEKELIATIKLSLIRGIIGMDEETLLNLVKKAIEEREGSK